MSAYDPKRTSNSDELSNDISDEVKAPALGQPRLILSKAVWHTEKFSERSRVNDKDRFSHESLGSHSGKLS